MSTLANKLKQKIESDGLTVTGAAEKAGISFPSFRAVLDGKSVPNARSVDKYASFLGISVDDVKSAAADADSPRAAGKRGRRGKRGPGRPRGKRGPGRPPGKRGPGRPRKNRGAIDAGAALAEVGAALDRANEVLGDELAMRVHALPARARQAIEAIVATLG